MFLKKLMSWFDAFLRNFSFLSLLFLRLGLGLAFIFHGIDKFPLPPEGLIKYFGFSSVLASSVALSEVASGSLLIISIFFKNFMGDLITRFSSLIILIIMIFAFYFAHRDWFFNSKLFTSEQIFLFLIGFFFFINGNKRF